MTDAVKYVVGLGRKHFEQLGFIPATRLEKDYDRGDIWLEYENGEPCGYLHLGRSWPVLNVINICIQYDARRREHGFKLIRRLIEKADREGYEAIRLRCADDLEANDFWRACGFAFTGQVEGGARRRRKINLWRFTLPRPIQPTLLTMEREPWAD